MGLPTDYDLAGNDLIVKSIKTGARAPGQSSNVAQTTAVGSTLTVNRATHLGRTLLLDTLTGSVATLPAATGTGDVYRFVVSVAPTSNNHIIKVANASDTMIGGVAVYTGAAASGVVGDFAASTDDTMTMNGTTTGGGVGAWFELEDVASTKWAVRGMTFASGVVATIFSATV
jgi:hypothetical protein